MLRRGPAVTAVVVGTTLMAGAGAAFAVTSLTSPAPAGKPAHDSAADLGQISPPAARTSHPAARPATVASNPAVRPTKTRRPAPRSRSAATASPRALPPVYRNPLRDVAALIPERVDMGVDFAGTGPVYALGDAVITNATGASTGWPGGGWITYQLTSGPAKGLQVYLAEDVQPTVKAGDHVTSSTVIGDMSNRGDGIETGWAMPDGASAESQLADAGGISGGGPFPTEVGLNFDRLLVALGAPAAPNLDLAGSGTLPAAYPVHWTSLLG
jgi:hypothetical protein